MTRRGRVLFDGQLAGWIEESAQGMSFRYSESWRTEQGAPPISVTMPVRSEPYESSGPMPFFMGLLPEGWLFDIAIARLKIARDDSFGLLLGLCRDCTGAVSIEPAEERPPEENDV